MKTDSGTVPHLRTSDAGIPDDLFGYECKFPYTPGRLRMHSFEFFFFYSTTIHERVLEYLPRG